MKLYYTRSKVSSYLAKFFSIFALSIPHLKSLSLIIPSMISAESVVSSDIARESKLDFSNIKLDSVIKRFSRFFSSFSSVAYSLYEAIISHIINSFSIKHSNIHITFDHMYVKDTFTVLLFSLRIGKQGIPLWFRCFKSKISPDPFSIDLIKDGITFCANLFLKKKCHVIFLADRWFPIVSILEHIQSLGCFYCVRAKGNTTFSIKNPDGSLSTSKISSISPAIFHSKVFKDILYTKKLFPTTLVIARSLKSSTPWYILTNDVPSKAVKNYSYRFGSIECIFKSQKTNGLRLESTNIQNENRFISLFTIVCISLLWLTILGTHYEKNKSHNAFYIATTKLLKTGRKRSYSFFNLGLCIFKMCYYNEFNYYSLNFDFVLYDI